MIARIVVGLIILAGSQVLLIQGVGLNEPVLIGISLAASLYGLYVVLTAGRHR